MKFKRCCLNFKVVKSLISLLCWCGTAWKLAETPWFSNYLDISWSCHYHVMIHDWSELYMCQCFIQAESLSLLSIKNEIIGPKTCEFWPLRRRVWPSVKQPVFLNMKAFIVANSAVYSLFIVLTATLRTDSSWVSSPSITEPNSPGETNKTQNRSWMQFEMQQWQIALISRNGRVFIN